MKYPTRFQQKTLWSAVTGLAILTLGSLLVALVWLIGQIFGFLQPVLVPLIVAGIVAYLLDPIVRLIEKRGISRLWSVIIVFLSILIAITLLIATVLPAAQNGRTFFRKMVSEPATETLTPEGKAIPNPAQEAPPTEIQLTEISQNPQNPPLEQPQTPNPNPPPTDQTLKPTSNKKEGTDLGPALARSLHDLRTKYNTNPIGWILTEITEEGEPLAYANGAAAPNSLDFFWRTRAGRTLFKYKSLLLEWLSIGSSKFLAFLGLVLGMIMVPIYLFFFLKDSVSIRNHWHEYVPLRASRFKTELVSTLQEINGYLISFFRGQVLVGIIDGILVGIALFFFDLPYALLIGVFMAILGIIPYIGNILCLIPACIIAYLHGQASTPFGLETWPYVGSVVLIFAGVQQINSLFTAPKIVGDSVGLHPLTVIFSMLFWSLILGGFVGALLAVPLSAAVKVIFQRYFWDKQMNETKPPGFPH